MNDLNLVISSNESNEMMIKQLLECLGFSDVICSNNPKAYFEKSYFSKYMSHFQHAVCVHYFEYDDEGQKEREKFGNAECIFVILNTLFPNTYLYYCWELLSENAILDLDDIADIGDIGDIEDIGDMDFDEAAPATSFMKDEKIYDPVQNKVLYGYYFPTCLTDEADTTAADIIEMMFEEEQREICETIAKERSVPVDWDNDDFDSEFFSVCKYVALKWRYIENNVEKIVTEPSVSLDMDRYDAKIIHAMLSSIIDNASDKGYTKIIALITEKYKDTLA